MNDVVFAGHTGITGPWAHGEIYRVFAKLAELGQLGRLHVALERGSAFTATEAALLANTPVVWHPLWAPGELEERFRSYPGYGPRVAALRAHRLLDVADDQLTGVHRAARRRRSSLLADISAHHVVVYDGRDRGSVLDHLQYVMGTHDVIVIDPSEQATRRIPPQQGAGPCPTPTTPTRTSSEPSTASMPH